MLYIRGKLERGACSPRDGWCRHGAVPDRVALLYRGEGAGAQLDRGTSAVWSENFSRVRVVRTEKGRDGIQLLQASGAARCARERWKFSWRRLK